MKRSIIRDLLILIGIFAVLWLGFSYLPFFKSSGSYTKLLSISIEERLAKELGISILFSVLGGGDGVMVSEIMRTAMSTVFDRGQEKEADDFSFALMEKAKLNPKSMSSFMRRLREKYASVEKYTDSME